MAKKQQPQWHIVRRSAIHRRGVFARSGIPKGTRIIEYVGERISKAESARRADQLLARSKRSGAAAVYIFEINSKVDLDGNVSWNPARLINHSCEANCEAYIDRGRIWIYAKRDIAKGEELSYNYGFDLENWKDHPCRCGAAGCIGYIADRKHWPRLRRLLEAARSAA